MMSDSLKNIFQSMSPEQLSYMSARVMSTNPLKIVATNNNKRVVTENSTIILSKQFQKSKSTMTFTLDGKLYENIEVEFDNTLQVGDIVQVLCLSKNEVYIILGKEWELCRLQENSKML